MPPLSRRQDRTRQDRRLVSVEDQAATPKLGAELLDLEEGVQEVHEELRKATISQVTLTLLAVFAICYFAKRVLVTIFTSILIAFILEPVVRTFARIRIPRTVGSALAVLLVLAMMYGLSYFFYQRAVDFAHQLPKMSGEIKKVIGKYQQNAAAIRNSAQNVIPEKPENRNAVPVRVQEDRGISAFIGGSDIANFGEVLITVAFIPFIVYFMLTWKDHARKATVRLFPPESRLTAYQTLGKISEMMKGFIVGNFVIGIFMAIASGIFFAFLHLPYFYFLGLISGFLSLVPYLGVILALLPPLASGAGVLHGSGFAIVVALILGLHVFSMNLLYPKVLGGRLELNPLAVTLGLLIWGWLWGAMGLILAVPVVGAIKIVCDNVRGLEPFGQLLGDGVESKKAALPSAPERPGPAPGDLPSRNQTVD
jgi:predicted PurR-regulated permease PerM